ncbi:MAG: HEPN domain-containing protein [Nitrospirota bacterium]
MKRDDLMEQVNLWINKAEGDIKLIEKTMNDDDSPFDLLCFHAQQAVEKYLKAYLVFKQVSFEKTHNLNYLLCLCIKENNKFLQIADVPEKLEDYAVIVRYPTGIFEEFNSGDVKEAYDLALKVKDIVINLISYHK